MYEFSIYSNRVDGFGERLRALLNAIILSDILNKEYYFSWRKMWENNKLYHSISDNPEDTFDSSFLTKHYKEYNEINSLKLISLNKFIESGGDIDNVSCDYQGILVSQQGLVGVTLNARKIDVFDYQKAFSKIFFHSELENIKESVGQLCNKEDSIAIHLRTGDIVYGEARFMEIFYNKIVPLYCVKEIIDLYKSKGKKIFLFGQDSQFCTGFSEDEGVIYTDALKKNNNPLHSAFFDIILMSLCEQIVAGQSGFAILAELIGNTKRVNYLNLLDKQQQIQAFDRFLSTNGLFYKNYMNNYLRAFSLAHFISIFYQEMSNERNLYLIELCIKNDPSNVRYQILKSLFLYKSDKSALADDILFSLLVKREKNDLIWLLEYKTYDQKNLLSKYIEEFRVFSNESVMVSTLIFLHTYLFLKVGDKDDHINIIRNTRETYSKWEKQVSILESKLLELKEE